MNFWCISISGFMQMRYFKICSDNEAKRKTLVRNRNGI